MSSDVSIEFRGSYLRANLPEGYEITPENVVKLWSVIGEACKKYECSRVLVEGKIASRKITPVTPIIERFLFGILDTPWNTGTLCK